MQKPITPTRPEQDGCSFNQRRTASIWSNTCP
jgi:hypothetical protein